MTTLTSKGIANIANTVPQDLFGDDDDLELGGSGGSSSDEGSGEVPEKRTSDGSRRSRDSDGTRDTTRGRRRGDRERRHKHKSPTRDGAGKKKSHSPMRSAAKTSTTRESASKSYSPRRPALNPNDQSTVNKRSAQGAPFKRSATEVPTKQAPLRRAATEIPKTSGRDESPYGRSATTDTNAKMKERIEKRSKSPKHVTSREKKELNGSRRDRDKNNDLNSSRRDNDLNSSRRDNNDLDSSSRRGDNNNSRRTRSPKRDDRISRGERISRSPKRTNSREGRERSASRSRHHHPRDRSNSKARTPRQVVAEQANQLLAALPPPEALATTNSAHTNPWIQQLSGRDEDEEEEEEEQQPVQEQQPDEEEEEEEPAARISLSRSDAKSRIGLTTASDHSVGGRMERGMGLSRAKGKREVRQATGESKHTSSAVQPGTYRSLINSSH